MHALFAVEVSHIIAPGFVDSLMSLRTSKTLPVGTQIKIKSD